MNKLPSPKSNVVQLKPRKTQGAAPAGLPSEPRDAPRDGPSAVSSAAPSAATPQAFDVYTAPLVGTQFVEASAGTGKTWALTALHLRLVLEQDLPVTSILVVTFTDAAVAELRTRVRARLLAARSVIKAAIKAASSNATSDVTADALDDTTVDTTIDTTIDDAVKRIVAQARDRVGDDAQLLKRVQSALAQLDDAPIRTIHGFCQRALQDAAFAARLAFQPEIQADDHELRLAAVNDFWRRDVATAALPTPLARWLAQREESPERWEPLLREHLKFPLARLLGHEADPSSGPRLQQAFDQARASWQREGIRARDALRLVKDGNSYSERRIDAAFECARQLFDASPISPYDYGLLKLYGSTWIQRRNKVVPPLALFDDMQSLLDARHAFDSAQLGTIAELKLRMVKDATLSLEATKAAVNVLTFQDLLTRLDKHLGAADDTGNALVNTLRQRYPAALIDEFQDTDPVQLSIFNKLYQGTQACVFLVGDPKQAIYGFRGADLASYLDARSQPGQPVHTLDHNQRSSPELLDAINALFTSHRAVFGDLRLSYRRSEPGPAPRKTFVDLRDIHNHAAGQGTAALRVWSLPQGEAGQQHAGAARRAAADAAAADIAATLAAAQAGQLSYDGRKLRGGDIAVLVRTHAEGQLMRRALAACGVASVELSRASVFHSLDAAELECLLHATLDPSKLRAAMATTLMGADANLLAASMSADEADAVDADIDAAAELDRSEADAAVNTTLARLVMWRATWQRHGIAAMLTQVFDTMAVPQRLLPTPDGERRMTNLLHLMELLGRQSQTMVLPQALLRWLGQQRHDARSSDETLLRLESDRQLVQIVTVHRAKGLQYPMVVLPFLWSWTPRAGEGGISRYHDKHHDKHDDKPNDKPQQIIDFRVLDKNRDTDELARIKAQQRSEAFEEQLRLIYVALTRAEHRCTLVIDMHVRQAAKKSYASLKSPLNWIVAGDGFTQQGWQDTKSKSEQRAAHIQRAWQRLHAMNAPHLQLSNLPSVQRSVAPIAFADEAQDVVLRHAPGPVLPSWRLASFSSLLGHDSALVGLLDTLDPAMATGTDRDAVVEAEGVVDDDASINDDASIHDPDASIGTDASTGADATLADAAATSRKPVVIADDDILRLPRGASAGDTVHATLERSDFARPDTWPAAIGAALRLHPVRGAGDAGAMLLSMLRNLAATPLAPGLKLGDIGAAQRLDELEFDLPLPALRINRLKQSLDRLALNVPALAAAVRGAPFHGHLRGFIDIVFEHAGRYYIADWKSNHLGDTPSHYNQPALARAMAAHGYHLQHVLYAVALRRHLRRCLGDAAADAAWGGAFVLFVRGIRPGWHDANGAPAGVYHQRLSPAALDELAQAFG